MALNKDILKQGFINASKAAQSETDIEKAGEVFAETLANAIDNYIKQADVSVNLVTGNGTIS